jgi:hypothetical protein
MTEEQLNQIKRDRQHGADIAIDQHRATTGNRLWRSVGYGTAILFTAVGLHLAAGAAENETDHAPRAPEPLASGPHQVTPTSPESPDTQP